MTTRQHTAEIQSVGDSVRDWFEDHRSILVPAISIVAGLVLWELYAMGQPAYHFPSLGAIWEAFNEQLESWDLVEAFVNSMQTLTVGYLIAVVVGIPLGLTMGLNRWADVTLNPYLNAMYVAPISALVPVLILLGGSSFETRVAVVFLFAVFEITIDTYEGVKTTPAGLLQAAESFGGDRLFVIRNVIIPHDLPYIFAGLRLGVGRAIIGMIVAELLIEFANLGYIIQMWQVNFRIAGVFSVVIILMLVGLTLTHLVKMVQRRVITWESEVDL